MEAVLLVTPGGLGGEESCPVNAGQDSVWESVAFSIYSKLISRIWGCCTSPCLAAGLQT